MKGISFAIGALILAACSPSGTPLGGTMNTTPPDLTTCQLTGIEYTNSADFSKFGDPNFIYTYDDQGRVTEVDEDQRGAEGRLIRTTYTYDGDTVRTAHRNISRLEGSQLLESTDLSWYYADLLLDSIVFVTNDTIHGVKNYFYNGDGRVIKVTTRTDQGDDLTETFTYTDGGLTGYSSTDGTDYTYTFDTKVNPESFLAVNLEFPIKAYPYNMTMRSDGYTFEYTYDTPSGYPIQRDVYLNSNKSRTDVYRYSCPDTP